MKQLNFDLKVTPRGAIKLTGTTNTELISVLKTLRANNKILGNLDKVKEINRDINKLNNYKINKSSTKRKAYINKQQIQIVTNIVNNFGGTRPVSTKMGLKINIPKLKASDYTRNKKRKNHKIIIENTNDAIDFSNYPIFQGIINSMGNNFDDAYSKYQDDVERLAKSLGIDLDEYLLNFET